MEECNEELNTLRHCWRTFMVPNGESVTRDLVGGRRFDGKYTLLRRYHILGTAADDQPLFFLSLIGLFRDLLSTTAHLFFQLSFQCRQRVLENEKKMMILRAHHEQQLLDLLEAANMDTKDMVVGSEITCRFVLRHQRDVEELHRQNSENELAVEAEARQSLLVFLKTSAPDALIAFAKEKERESGKLRAHGEGIARVTDIAHFVSTAVPVRTVELPNFLSQRTEEPQLKSSSLRPIVLDVSPLSFLQQCLGCIYSKGDDTVSAVEEHLLRLSRQTYAVLLLIGLEEEAESLLSIPSAELLLHGPSFSGKSRGFLSLRRYPHLKFMITTRFWGANIIFLWTPPKNNDADDYLLSNWPCVVEDALKMAFSWNADMFSVAILQSSVPLQSPSCRNFAQREQDVSVAILRQLQRAVACLAYQTAGVRISTVWDMSVELELQGLQRPKLRRWEDGYVTAFPVSAGAPQLTFNTDIAIRVFLPSSLLSTHSTSTLSVSSLQGGPCFVPTFSESGGKVEIVKRKKKMDRHSTCDTLVLDGDSVSSDVTKLCGVSCDSQSRMSFENLLVYAFGESVVIH